MAREQARQEIRNRYAEYLQPARKPGTFICPLCGNGSGSDGDGLAINRKDPEKVHLKCFKCGFYGDIIELIKQEKGLATDAEAFEEARSFFNVDADGPEDPGKPQTAEPVKAAPEEPPTDYTEYFEQMAGNLGSAESYLSSRCISLETARRFMLGYDMRWIHPKTEKEQREKGSTWLPPRTKRLIIPVNRYSYVARATTADVEKQYQKLRVGNIGLFNAKALHNAEKRPVFITEGEIDALSIIEAGGIACSIGSANSWNLLPKYLKDNPTESTLLITLDNDEAGQKAAADLEKKLTEDGMKPGIDFEAVKIYGDRKDANEALCADPDGFRAAIRTAEAKHRPGAAMVQSFLQAISSRKYEPMPTGLDSLDELIGGGFLRQTLVMLGAAPGMGKSFFAQQLFEGMAQQGHNVLYFNLEMSREQMLARSFARLARTRENATMTALDVLQGYKWTDAQRAIVERTAAAYSADIAPHMAYNPGGGTAQLDAILEQMESAAQRTKDAGKEAPLVVIDYLHLLRGGQREDVQVTVKRAINAFKGYAIKYNTIVFIVYANNRDNNKQGKVTQEGGRDSSAIEYSADLQLGLNFTKLEENESADDKIIEKIREAVKNEGREKGHIDYKLKVLKSRLQGGGGSIDLSFAGKYGLFFPKYDRATGMQQTDEDLPRIFVDIGRYKRKK